MKNLELLNSLVTLERFPGKGGWTFAPVPVRNLPGGNSFGMLKVTGRIDDYELAPSHLMPMGDGRLFLPVRADIRKRIGKQAGDAVRLVLYAETAPLQVSEEDFLECIADEPAALHAYQALTRPEKQAWLQWVRAAPSDDVKVVRMTAALKQLAAGQSRQST